MFMRCIPGGGTILGEWLNSKYDEKKERRVQLFLTLIYAASIDEASI